MISAYELQGGLLKLTPADDEQVTWWDLLHPTQKEENRLEARLGLVLPTQDEMREIEATSRLYSEDGGHFMTVLVPAQTKADETEFEPITFILTGHRLITIRYSEPRSFDAFLRRAEKSALGLSNGETVLLALLEVVVDRLADILERVGQELDTISRTVFGQKGVEARAGANYKLALEGIGRKGDLASNIRDSLATLERVLAFLGYRLAKESKAVRNQHKALVSDVRSLADHVSFTTQKITFLLDATLGLINIEQNAIIKIFSIAAVVFLPPTLVASLYGMNFDYMPELHWGFGYPMAICLMIGSAILPYIFFKRRGWL